MNFSNKLYCILQKKGMTQADLSRKSGLSEVSISRYMSGERLPNCKAIMAICDALACTPNDLLL